MAYISNFLLNLVFFDCLQKRGFEWSYHSSKILKNNQIIRYTRFYNNNYEIGNNKIGKMAFATFVTDPTTLKNSQPYKKPYFTAILDTWHRKMCYIDLLRLYMLGKECLRVWLWSKKMFQYSHFIVFKISQQILHCPPANQSIQLFYNVYTLAWSKR